MKTQNKKRPTNKILLGMAIVFLSGNVSFVTANAWDTKHSKEEMEEATFFGKNPIRSFPRMDFADLQMEVRLPDRTIKTDPLNFEVTSKVPTTKGKNASFTLKVVKEVEPTSLFEDWTTYLKWLIGRIG